MTKQTDTAQPPDLSAQIDKVTLVSDLSHELRTVLGGVIGINELLLTTDLTPHQRQLAETIDQSSMTLLNGLNDIVDFARVDFGRIKIDDEPVDMRRIVEETAIAFDKLSESRNSKLDCCIEGLPMLLMGDAARLRQITKTLTLRLLSAVEGGTVAVRAYTEEAGGGLMLHICATGEPIAEFTEPHLATLSEPLRPGRKFDSRWLSLYLCAQLVSLMKGSCGSTITDNTCELMVCIPTRAAGI